MYTLLCFHDGMVNVHFSPTFLCENVYLGVYSAWSKMGATNMKRQVHVYVLGWLESYASINLML